MGTLRIKGQETILFVNATGQGTIQLTNIKNFNVEVEMDILQEGYTGQTTDQFDDIMKGVGGDFELHADSPTAIDFAMSLVDRAQRRVPLFQVNLQTTLNFPNGQRRKIIVPDVSFGAQPMNVSSRSDYVTWRFTWKGSQPRAIA